ncbi:MAG: U32 family peptidase, partial [Muribaculaceae bacterium]|nr:U32 family peptidase [Muribaculaceae bacterium]
MKMTRNEFEIMAPVGCLESLYAAIQGSANSVYFGIQGLNMRSGSANNFTKEMLPELAKICRDNGIKSYLTVNTILFDNDIATMHAIVDAAKEAGISAIIASDIATILYARSRDVEVHISTQVNITNTEAVKFYSQWADVVVLAREVNLVQVAEIHRAIVDENICGPHGEPIKIEMFCHGALCMAVSGKCYLSLHEADSSANRGACRQICRRSYIV